jgi:hypothetical protein
MSSPAYVSPFEFVVGRIGVFDAIRKKTDQPGADVGSREKKFGLIFEF